MNWLQTECIFFTRLCLAISLTLPTWLRYKLAYVYLTRQWPGARQSNATMLHGRTSAYHVVHHIVWLVDRAQSIAATQISMVASWQSQRSLNIIELQHCQNYQLSAHELSSRAQTRWYNWYMACIGFLYWSDSLTLALHCQFITSSNISAVL